MSVQSDMLNKLVDDFLDVLKRSAKIHKAADLPPKIWAANSMLALSRVTACAVHMVMAQDKATPEVFRFIAGNQAGRILADLHSCHDLLKKEAADDHN